ncbi:MAG: vitamin B12 dependent methionine synthase [Candidatus Atribacteria bacterium]|nr:vitamin B12 dependent methionine synthase [Candidatus Atribacteria bacterium]
METIDPIPVTLDPAEITARLRFDPVRAGFKSLDELIALAQGLIRPRAVYEVAYTGAKGKGTVDVAGVTFHSPILRKNLDGANKVFPYIITVGPELERAASTQGDLLKQYYLEEMANMALESAAGWLGGQLEARYGVTGLANMSPGSLEDWPITEQTKLFSIFGDTEKAVGVRLTDSMLMLPRKSISGILFPSEEGFVACQLCERERCPGRKAAYLKTKEAS